VTLIRVIEHNPATLFHFDKHLNLYMDGIPIGVLTPEAAKRFVRLHNKMYLERLEALAKAFPKSVYAQEYANEKAATS